MLCFSLLTLNVIFLERAFIKTSDDTYKITNKFIIKIISEILDLIKKKTKFQILTQLQQISYH